MKLERGELHVWFARVDHRPARLTRTGTILDPEEKARAESFHGCAYENLREFRNLGYGAEARSLVRSATQPSPALRAFPESCRPLAWAAGSGESSLGCLFARMNNRHAAACAHCGSVGRPSPLTEF